MAFRHLFKKQKNAKRLLIDNQLHTSPLFTTGEYDIIITTVKKKIRKGLAKFFLLQAVFYIRFYAEINERGI